jgi:hypothetical protein
MVRGVVTHLMELVKMLKFSALAGQRSSLAAGADYVGLDDTYKNQRWLD